MNKIVGILIFTALFSGCTSGSQYLGKTVTDLRVMCGLYELDGSSSQSCRTETPALSFDLIVEKGKDAGDYTVRGTATTKMSTVYHKMVAGNFNLLLIDGRRVIEDIPFFPDRWMTRKDNIFLEFNTKNRFNGIAIGYSDVRMGDQ